MGKTWQDLTHTNENDVLVVDGLNLSFRWKHSGAKVFAEDYISTVQSLAKSYKCGKIIITSDWGSSSFRKNLFPEYKANREELRANQTEQEAQDFIEFLEEFNRALELCDEEGWLVLRYHKVEADDIAAYVVKNRVEYKIDNIWLVSSDKDWDLLVDEHTSRFSYVTRKDTTLSNWGSHYGFDRENFITYKCLTGDKGDNIPGIPGIGDKRAIGLIEEYGDVFEIYNSCPIDSKYKYIKNLNGDAEQLLLNIELMDLLSYCDEAIGYNNCLDIDGKVWEFMNGTA
jgi:5'-3' exonuclease